MSALALPLLYPTDLCCRAPSAPGSLSVWPLCCGESCAGRVAHLGWFLLASCKTCACILEGERVLGGGETACARVATTTSRRLVPPTAGRPESEPYRVALTTDHKRRRVYCSPPSAPLLYTDIVPAAPLPVRGTRTTTAHWVACQVGYPAARWKRVSRERASSRLKATNSSKVSKRRCKPLMGTASAGRPPTWTTKTRSGACTCKATRDP